MSLRNLNGVSAKVGLFIPPTHPAGGRPDRRGAANNEYRGLSNSNPGSSKPNSGIDPRRVKSMKDPERSMWRKTREEFRSRSKSNSDRVRLIRLTVEEFSRAAESHARNEVGSTFRKGVRKKREERWEKATIWIEEVPKKGIKTY